jgi:hypothetical protein
MANKFSISVLKRDRETIRQDRYKLKQLRREEVKARKARAKDAKREDARLHKERGEGTSGIEDPAIAGIRPGPQPLPEQWDLD